MKSRSMRFSILSALAGLLIITVSVIILYSYIQNTKSTLKLSDELISQANDIVIEKTMNYLKPAVTITKISSQLAKSGAISLTQDDEMENLAIEILNSYPQLSSVNIGDENGNFIMPKKTEDGTIATKIINRNIAKPTFTWKYRDTTGKVIKTTVSTDVKYDPRIRPWYIGSKENMDTFWTGVYIFFTDKVPGLTAAYPVTDAKGNFWGVFSVDIVLGELSVFLSKLKVGKTGVAFILNEKDEVISYPQGVTTIKEVIDENGKKKLKPMLISEIDVKWVTSGIAQYNKHKKDRFIYSFERKRYIANITPFPESFGKTWRIVLIVPENDFIGSVKFTNLITMLISIAILLVAVFFSFFLSSRISKPIILLTNETKKITDFDLDSDVEIKSTIREIQLMSDSIATMKSGLRAFKKYVPADLVRQLIKSGEEARLGGKKRELTIFFSDIANFTSISEKMEPEGLMLHLSEYLDEMTRVLMNNNATVDKYIGDAIMAFWGAPYEDPDHVFNACRAALQFQKRLNILNENWLATGKPPFYTRIGINTDFTIIGNMGASDRMNYSILGDGVNLASRLEGANKVYGSSIIVSETTYEVVHDRFIFRPLDIVAVKGKLEGVRIYELADEKSVENAAKLESRCNAFSKGIEFYLKQNWKEAHSIFVKLYKQNPSDKAVKIYILRCREYSKNHPPPDWDGITRMKSK